MERRRTDSRGLRRAFAALPANYRAALVMRELKGASYSEIAATLGITLPALEALIFRARAALREHLEEQLFCSEIGLAISKQMDGELAPAQQRALRAHLRNCPACARLARSQRAQRKTLRSLLLVPLPLTLKTFLPGGADAAAAIAGGGSAAAIGSTSTLGGSAAGGAGLAAKVAVALAASALVGGGGYEGITHAEPFLTPKSPAPAHHGPVRAPRAHSEKRSHRAVGTREHGNAIHRRAHAKPKNTPRAATHRVQANQKRASERQHPTESRESRAYHAGLGPTPRVHTASTGHGRPLLRTRR
jgi:Sigma-70, region 4/Putative zinc-finger